MLEELYAKFNVSRPDDFTGHNLSVSDIMALRQNGVVSCHYVDSIGFQELPGFLKPENYLKAAEMAMEDDYGMIDITFVIILCFTCTYIFRSHKVSFLRPIGE